MRAQRSFSEPDIVLHFAEKATATLDTVQLQQLRAFFLQIPPHDSQRSRILQKSLESRLNKFLDVEPQDSGEEVNRLSKPSRTPSAELGIIPP